MSGFRNQFHDVNKRKRSSPSQVPKKEQVLSHFSRTQQSGSAQVDHCLSHPSHVKKEPVLSSTRPQNATCCERQCKRKRKSSAPSQPANTAKTEEQIIQTTPRVCDNSYKTSLVLPSPRKLQHLEPPHPRTPSIPPLSAKTKNPSYDEVVIVSERIVKKSSQQASKGKQSQAIPIVPQRSDEKVTEPPSPRPVVTSQTEGEKEKLIQEYALYVVERDEETNAITWVVCKFCPIYGCQRRQRQYIMAYHVPLCRHELDRHVEREHQKMWRLFKTASKEQKKDMFYRKRMPLNHVLQRRIAELKLNWGMKRDFTDVQQTAWREQGKIEKRWKKSSRARKKVTVETVADNLGIDLRAMRDVNNQTMKLKESIVPREKKF